MMVPLLLDPFQGSISTLVQFATCKIRNSGWRRCIALWLVIDVSVNHDEVGNRGVDVGDSGGLQD
jgi:hypothetical protein